MKKIKVGRNNFVTIHKMNGIIDYQKWVEYIENDSDCFIWYENTTDGQKTQNSI